MGLQYQTAIDEIAEMQGQQTKLRHEADHLRLSNEQLQAQLTQQATNENTELSSMQQKQKQLQHEVDHLRISEKHLQAQLDQVTSENSELSSMQRQQAALQHEVDHLRLSGERLQSQLAQTTTENSDLRHSVKLLEGEAEVLPAKLKALSHENELMGMETKQFQDRMVVAEKRAKEAEERGIQSAAELLQTEQLLRQAEEDVRASGKELDSLRSTCDTLSASLEVESTLRKQLLEQRELGVDQEIYDQTVKELRWLKTALADSQAREDSYKTKLDDMLEGRRSKSFVS